MRSAPHHDNRSPPHTNLLLPKQVSPRPTALRSQYTRHSTQNNRHHTSDDALPLRRRPSIRNSQHTCRAENFSSVLSTPNTNHHQHTQHPHHADLVARLLHRRQAGLSRSATAGSPNSTTQHNTNRANITQQPTRNTQTKKHTSQALERDQQAIHRVPVT